MTEISSRIKEFILNEFLPGESPDKLADSTPLIAGGILDSIGIVKLIAFLEEQFSIELQPQEVDTSHLGTLSDITRLVQAKLENRHG